MYKILRRILFLFTPETIHHIVLKLVILTKYLPITRSFIKWRFTYKDPSLEKELFGIKFNNPIGLAAGLDKNGECYNQLANFGFSFIEIGSITPEAQPGNVKPRCFRLPKESALINRMGINNNGVKYTLKQLKDEHPNIIVGGNISKGTLTPIENAGKDYERSFALLYDFVDYFVINVSCPNVKDLAKLQDINALSDIIDRLLNLRRYYEDYRPILIKVSPDIPKEHLDDIIETILISGIDGIVATNTTNDRSMLPPEEQQRLKDIGNGGLSGQPLFKKSLSMVKYISNKTNGTLPIIGVGGIMTPEQAKEMLDAGASLIQVYTGFIYNGPGFVKDILKYLVKEKVKENKLKENKLKEEKLKEEKNKKDIIKEDKKNE